MDSAEVTDIKRHFDATADGLRADAADAKRHLGVIAEGLRSEIRLVAEAVSSIDARLDREVSTLRAEMHGEFEETRAMIRLSYTELDRRIRTLESGHAELETRVERLEAR